VTELVDRHELDLVQFAGLADDLEDPVDHWLGVGAEDEAGFAAGWRLEPKPQEVTPTIRFELNSP
jgi:hypothetical protein